MSAWLMTLVTVIYIGVALSEWRGGRWPMAVVFLGYALANVGLIVETMK